MDVLAYSAFNRQAELNKQIREKENNIVAKNSDIASLNSCLSVIPTLTCWTSVAEPILLKCPHLTEYWGVIPDLTDASDGFKVCSSGGCFTDGACCAWTVPAGVTCARFQLWGAGGGSAAGLCCGGSPFGSTGAYASVIIPVTAGDTYTLCAGCANCCYVYCTSSGRYPGCPSYVVGNGLSNFCARGGQGPLGEWMAQSNTCNIARIQQPNCGSSGACICANGAYYCYDNSCATCGLIPYVPGSLYFGSTTSGSIVYGIRGIWPEGCFNTGHCGYWRHPPIYGFESTTQCCFVFDCCSCLCTFCGCVCKACCGFLCVPGAGGHPSALWNGANGVTGDAGRKGMVCVSFK